MKIIPYIASLFLTWNLPASPSASLKQAPKQINPNLHGIGRWIPDLPFVTVNGNHGKLSDFKNKKALVIAFTGVSCPISKRFAPTLAQLEKEFLQKEIGILFIDPISTKDSRDKLQKMAKKLNLNGPVVLDENKSLSTALGAISTGDTFLLDAARTLLYRGPVSDQYGIGYQLERPRRQYLREALIDHLRGRVIESPAFWAPGCELDISSSISLNQNWTYHNRISRILAANCVECHRENGVAPFPLEHFDEVEENAGMIRKVVSEGIMPPWFASSPHSGQETIWANDRSLSHIDKTDLLAWIQNGKHEGDWTDAPLPFVRNHEWNIGEPDVVFSLPKEIEVKATGLMPYINLQVQTNFPEDRWIEATEVRPTSPKVVHHVLVFASSEKGGGREKAGALAAYVPGNTFVEYPQGVAKRLPAGATLFFQMHYTPTGIATTDRTQIGFRFAKEKPSKVIKTIPVANQRIDIPPHKSNHFETATRSLPKGTVVRAYMPHMHLRGKAIKYQLLHPNGRKETLLDVPQYDFNWQLRYELREPRTLPNGSQILVTGVFDNSEQNPANPDPNARVRWGDQSEDEMLIGYLECEFEAESDNELTSRHDDLFNRLDKNKDGFLTKDEFTKPHLFSSFDTNRDHRVTIKEGREGMNRLKKRDEKKKKKDRSLIDSTLDKFL